MSVSITRPQAKRKVSRIPGSFDDMEEDDLLHAGDADDHDTSSDHLTSFLPGPHDPSSLLQPFDENRGSHPNNTVLEEHEMNQKLSDFESSFLPEYSQSERGEESNVGVDDTCAFGVPNNNLAVRKRPQAQGDSSLFRDLRSEDFQQSAIDPPSPKTPPARYSTPGPEQEPERDMEQDNQITRNAPNTSSLETMSSSPTAAAAARTVSRVQSQASLGGYATANEQEYTRSPSKRPRKTDTDQDPTPRKNDIPPIGLDGNTESSHLSQESVVKRPQYLHKRSSQARLSYDSMASSNTETSDATLGADFALQSGGALPEPRLQRKIPLPLSRSTSLGSMASGMSALSDEEVKGRRSVGVPDLSTLEEESPRSNRAEERSPHGPITPRASAANLAMPTDTIIANNVRDIQVPGTFARQYRQERAVSPEKISGTTPAPKRGMTLKEQRHTVEKLGKENFDLKMKIHFLDQALQRRSEDGIKEIITENVQLKSGRLRLEKDNHNLKKQVRDLQKKLEENGSRESPGVDQGYGTDDERSPTVTEELIYLRERVETNEIEIEKLRSESMAKEAEKRRLAEMVRSLGDTRAGISDVGSREERDMWKDMLEAETIAREQSEDDNKRLRDEISKLRQDTFGQSRKRQLGSVMSRSSSVEGSQVTKADNAELERLRHETSELQKTIGAQASALTSRNKEKERLYQEIEDLKIGRMGGLRSVAGDSILDRSASRARANSRASIGTRASRLSDPERENLEIRINELRDEVSQLKLDNQSLKGQLDEALAELDAVDAQFQADVDQFNEELGLLSQERDNALRDSEEQDQAFQQLKHEAQEEIDGLGDELDAKVEECSRLEQDLKVQAENVKALQAEMRSASEGLIRLEEDAQQNLSKYQAVKNDLEDANRELESAEKSLSEADSKIQRLTVQQESSHNEIAFLREEQDADKIKIGDLEALLKKTHLNLDSERDKARELERRLTEERQQREAVANQEKQEVQKMLNDLNRENSNSRDEIRRIRKALSSREIESSTYKERLAELEDVLRQTFNDQNATRSNLIGLVTKLHSDHEQAQTDLDSLRRRLDERESLLKDRDGLLESSGLEYRKIADMLERERQARRQDKHNFEQSLKSHQQSTRALTVNNSRVVELEQGRQTDRRRMAQMETQYRDQLSERNQILLTIWKKLSAMCGPDWAHNNSLINGNLPSQEVIGNMLFWPGFSRNLLLAVKQVEGTLTNFKDKIKRIERELWKEYQVIEHTLEVRTKKLERIEQSWEQMKFRQAETDAQGGFTPRATQRSSRTPEVQKLKGENRLLKAELQLLQQQHANAQYRAHARDESRNSGASGGVMTADAISMDGASVLNGGIPPRGSSRRSGRRPGMPERHHSEAQSMRSASIASSRNSNVHEFDRGRSLMIPAGPFNAPTNGNFSMPSNAPLPAPGSPNSGSLSDIGTITSTTTQQGQGYDKWIHRLRELERRLKAEREARLIDRGGMRKRLEERDAVNEELRRELERERVRRGFGGGRDVDVDTLRHPDVLERGRSGDGIGSDEGYLAGEARAVELDGGMTPGLEERGRSRRSFGFDGSMG